MIGKTHYLKDADDISKPDYTYGRGKLVHSKSKPGKLRTFRRPMTAEESEGRLPEDIQDFMRPDDPIGTRTCGFSRGHVRLVVNEVN